MSGGELPSSIAAPLSTCMRFSEAGPLPSKGLRYRIGKVPTGCFEFSLCICPMVVVRFDANETLCAGVGCFSFAAKAR